MMKADTPQLPASGFELAKTSAKSAAGAIEISVFSPFNTKLLPSFLAVVDRRIASEPLSGSFIAKHPILLPIPIGGK